MVILVTGGAGYIGSHMAWYLKDLGHVVVVVDNLSTGCKSLVPPQARFVQADVGDTPRMTEILEQVRPDGIIHMAGSVVVPESVANPMAYYHNNTIATFNLLQAAVACGIKNVVFSSTAAVYGNPETPVVTETAPTVPTSPYGRTKLMSEQMFQDVAANGAINLAILRYFNVAGADPMGRTGQSTANATHLIKVACETSLGKQPNFQIFGTDYDTFDGSCIRDFIHVWDLVNAHALVLEHLVNKGGNVTLNCGYGKGFSVRQVLRTVEKLSGAQLRVTASPRRAGDIACLVADPAQLKTKYGWTPEFDDLESIIWHALRWEQHLAGPDVAEQHA